MQIPKVKAGVSSQLQQRALKVMFEFMNQPRWGGLIANLTHRALVAHTSYCPICVYGWY